eukprot:5585383-Pleurochrysis_carterae.AAC.1
MKYARTRHEAQSQGSVRGDVMTAMARASSKSRRPKVRRTGVLRQARSPRERMRADPRQRVWGPSSGAWRRPWQSPGGSGRTLGGESSGGGWK